MPQISGSASCRHRDHWKKPYLGGLPKVIYMDFFEAKMSLGCPGRDMMQIYISGVQREF